LLFFSAGIFWYFSYKEVHSGWIRTKWWILVLYNIGGKWLAAGIFAVIGVLGIAMGLMLYFGRRKLPVTAA
jgi:hypothetical protein